MPAHSQLADEQQRALMVQMLQPYIPQLRRVAYSKHIITRLERLGALHASMPLGAYAAGGLASHGVGPARR